MAAAKKKIKVTLLRSTNSVLPNHKKCVQGLGLKKIRSSVILQDNPCIRGMIQKVNYLLAVEEV